MNQPKIELKNPLIAGVLAFLLPGAGHFYQGRLFKAGVYFVCILGLFFSGMAMADWKAVQPPQKPNPTKISMLKYSAQLAVGIPSMYGLLQRERYYSEANQSNDYELSPLTAPFTGELEVNGDESIVQEIRGTVHLEPVTNAYGSVSYAGTLETNINGVEKSYKLGQGVRLGRPIAASEHRHLDAKIIQDPESPYSSIGTIYGSIPRPFADWYQVPMEEDQVEDLHRELGKYHELAMVFTWVAGLLNILAIWDAVEGPAYGFDDTEEKADESAAADA